MPIVMIVTLYRETFCHIFYIFFGLTDAENVSSKLGFGSKKIKAGKANSSSPEASNHNSAARKLNRGAGCAAKISAKQLQQQQPPQGQGNQGPDSQFSKYEILWSQGSSWLPNYGEFCGFEGTKLGILLQNSVC